MTETVALVVAAGRGVRLGGAVPKTYIEIAGRSILRRSLEAFCAHARVDAVRAVIHADDVPLYREATAGLALLEPVTGGATRQDSVRNGLESLVDLAPAKVLIHDGARPFVDGATIDRVIDALDRHAGALAAVPVTDTVKRTDGDLVVDTLDRSTLWRAQTPQGFRFADILRAHRAANRQDFTDDAAVAEAAGLAVAVVPGSEANVKVTTPEDLARFERDGAADTVMEYRTGQGIDVHRFAPGDAVTLCGIKIPHEFGLSGHSDADVGLHALTDAILGAIGAGDIGSHFPPSDPQWRGADSAQFLRHAVDLVAQRGGAVTQLDLTLICERPKIGPHRAAMVARVAEIVGIDPARVSVKATTTEGLGFTGRREGIAGLASATVRLPAGP
jgi:2-C-methyl-D-erythritol 4-phosphate cytidylyltransferase/2-C-methyl-D-erythritol 2,4-cyclodiphosphate synthase